MTQLTLKTGFDVDYYLDQVGADYYLTAAGEPPGIWMGTGAEGLGLRGDVDADTMRALYHNDVGPDGEPLTTRQRKPVYRAAAVEERAREAIDAAVAALGRFVTPEEIREIELREKAKIRTQTPFYDYTLSVPKSVSLLYAGHLAAAKRARDEQREQDAEQHEAEARAIERALIETTREHVALMEQKTAIVRTGHHSATTGQWRDARGLVVASFLQHDNRQSEPNLHIQMTILNRAQRADGADEKWRALDGAPLWAERLGLAALDTRIFAQKLAEQGIPLVQQASGNGFDVGGVTQETMDAFSTRTAGINRRLDELLAEYQQMFGHAPDRRALFMLRKRATLETRKAKHKDAPEAERALAAWIRHAEDQNVQSLEALPEAVAAYAAEHGPSELPSESERARAIRIAVAEVQRVNASWTRSKLLFELQRALPALPADVAPVPYFEALADEALTGQAEDVEVVQIAPVSDVVDTSRLDHRKNGTSVYRRPGEARYVTAEHLDHEEWILKTSVSPVPQRVTAEAAAARVSGTDLDYHQWEAVKGFLASQRLVNCLVAPAGTGKTRTMAAFSHAWIAETGCRVIGLTTSENAARVLAGEGMTETYNLARFLGKIKDSGETRPHVAVHEGDVLVLDEATQIGTADLLRVMQIARRAGAMIVGTFDPAQLGAVEAGGMFPLIAARHGSRRLYDVRRFERAWEREASLKLRDGDISALLAYKGHGMVRDGAEDRMHDEAVGNWVTDYLQGKSALLLAGSNEEAARLAKLARERLADLGQISGANEITLADGNAAGTGDLVRARLNTKIDAGGQTLSNRDTIKITGWQGTGSGRSASVIRRTSIGGWSAPFLVPAAYLEQSAELDYAGNVFVSQGRTVDVGHLVVTAAMMRALLYVGMTRGREQNRMYVATGAAEPEAMTRQEREAIERERMAEAVALLNAGDPEAAMRVDLAAPEPEPTRPRAPWEAVIAQVLHEDDPLTTALEQMKAAQDLVSHGGHLLQLSEAFWQVEVVPQIDEAVRQRLGPREYERYLKDPERPAFLQLLRTHEIGGRPVGDSLDAITGRDFTGARSIAGTLHGRLEKERPPARGETTTFAERAPGGAAPLTREAYEAADARQAEVGRQLAARPEEWALRAWGAPPAESGALRDDWEKRAGLVGLYREVTGITDPKVAMGPVPTGQAAAREMFHASVRALELENEQALLKAMGRGDLEARVREYDRAQAVAPADVTAELDSVTRQIDYSRRQAEAAAEAGNDEIARGATGLADVLSGRLADLQVADAARREWAEATAGPEIAARTAEAELRQRDLAVRIPVTDTEVAEAGAETRERPAMDPAKWAELKAGQGAWLQAAHDAEAEKMAQLTPVTDPEIAKYGGRRAEPDAEAESGAQAKADADLAEVHAAVDAAAAAVDEMPDRNAERAAEIDQAGIDEPVIHEPEAEPELEPSWQQGDVQSQAEAGAPEPSASIDAPEVEADFELEM